MFLFAYSSSDTNPQVLDLISSIDSKNYEECTGLTSMIANRLSEEKQVRYLSIENEREKTKILKNWNIDKIPVLLEIDCDEIVNSYTMENLFIDEFLLDLEL